MATVTLYQHTPGTTPPPSAPPPGPPSSPPPPPPPPPAAPPPAPATSGLVTRAGKNLRLDGANYKFVGFNDFSLTGCHTGNAATNSELDTFFTAMRPRTVTRTWAFDHSGDDGIARVVAKAEEHNQKVLLVLQEGAGHCGSPGYDRGWYQGGYQGALYDWIDYICDRFKASPAVIWEICNEAGQDGGEDMTQAECKAYLHNAGGRIKLRAPNQLVSSGLVGSWRDFCSGQAGYYDVHNSVNIDIVGSHEYEYDYNGNAGVQGRHADEIAAANALAKPFIIGEVGCARTSVSTSAQTRADVFASKMNAYLNADTAGVLYWTLTLPENDTGSVNGLAANDAWDSPVVTKVRTFTHAQLPVYSGPVSGG